VAFCLVHEAEKLHDPFKRKIVDLSEACIHHYWTRTEEFCFQKRGMSKLTNPEFFEAMHKVKDETILQYVSQLKGAQ
jgi:hypothetical protein